MLTRRLQVKIITGNILPQLSNIRKCLCVAKHTSRIQCLGKPNDFVNSKRL